MDSVQIATYGLRCDLADNNDEAGGDQRASNSTGETSGKDGEGSVYERVAYEKRAKEQVAALAKR